MEEMRFVIFLSSKCYSYICENDIPKNINKLKNNVLHTKGILNYYAQQFIDHNLFKETLLNNDKPQKLYLILFQLKNK